jgi:hypothetical protein
MSVVTRSWVLSIHIIEWEVRAGDCQHIDGVWMVSIHIAAGACVIKLFFRGNRNRGN